MNCANLPQVMVYMAQNRLLTEVLHAVAAGIAECKNVVLARIWLIAPGDICKSCRFRAECPDQTRCLHLVASAGNPGAAKQNYARLDGTFRRFPLGVRKSGAWGNPASRCCCPMCAATRNGLLNPSG